MVNPISCTARQGGWVCRLPPSNAHAPSQPLATDWTQATLKTTHQAVGIGWLWWLQGW